MAGVLGAPIQAAKEGYSPQRPWSCRTAKEILAEVFQVRLSEVDEMIRCRSEAGERGSNEGGLWPQEFWLEGRGSPDRLRS